MKFTLCPRSDLDWRASVQASSSLRYRAVAVGPVQTVAGMAVAVVGQASGSGTSTFRVSNQELCQQSLADLLSLMTTSTRVHRDSGFCSRPCPSTSGSPMGQMKLLRSPDAA